MRTKLIYLTFLLAGAVMLFGGCRQNKQGTPGKDTAGTGPTSARTEEVMPVANEAINDAARFVAGLSVQNKNNSKLYALTQTKEWKTHAHNMDQIWNSYQQSAPKVLSFSINELEDINRDNKTLFYPFGGPDFLFSSSFFPEMDTYFLIGLERTGHAIQVKYPSAKTYRLYQDAVSDVLSLSFFRTRDMNTEQVNDTIDGVIPIISMLMARTDKQIVSIEEKILDSRGEIIAADSDAKVSETAKLVEIAFFHKGKSKLQKLYYYATDISNEGLAANQPLIAYIKKQDRKTTVTFIKSASYLMHEQAFSSIREMILNYSGTVVQDDSGIPLKFYTPDKWETTLYGTFYKPTTTYAKYPQPELRDAYQTGDPKPLSFRIGFARQSNLQIMRSK